MQKQDYIEQLIAQLAASIARIGGLGAQKSFDEAERELDAAWGSLGFRRADVKRLDDMTLRALLGQRIVLAKQLFEAEVTLEEARGNVAAAESAKRRAAAL